MSRGFLARTARLVNKYRLIHLVQRLCQGWRVGVHRDSMHASSDIILQL